MLDIVKKVRKGQRHFLDTSVRLLPNLGLDARAESFVELFEKSLPEKSSILDIGGGWGFYAQPLKRRGHCLTILEVVKPGYQKAPVVIYDGGRFPFPDKSFDAGMLMTVLHHIAEPEKVIREARRVTRNLLIVVEDLYHHALGRLWTHLRDSLFNFEFVGHAAQFKKEEEWIEIFEREGFKLLEIQNVFTWIAGLRILNGVFIFQVAE